MTSSRTFVCAAAAFLFGVGATGTVPAQVVMHEERTWVGPPFPMGDYDEQWVPIVFLPVSPFNPAGACLLVPSFPAAPNGVCLPTLWHIETDCCAAGAGPPVGWGPTFAAYNQGDVGPAFFHYSTGVDPFQSVNAGAIASYGIGAAAARPPGAPGVPGQEIVLCFDYVKVTELFGDPTFDVATVEVRPAPCGEAACFDPTPAGWVVISHLSTLNNGCATPITCCIGPNHPILDSIFIRPPASTPDGGKIRFRFDSLDPNLNAYCGWMVDNVVLTNEECDPPCPVGGVFQPQIGSIGGEPVSPNPGYAITLAGAPPGSGAILNLGNLNLAPAPLPFPPGCFACCAPATLLPAVTVNASGGATLPIPIPPGLAPCGLDTCVQWFVVVPGGTVLSSSAGKVRIQFG